MTAMAANAGRYPVSAQCEILGVPRLTCCAMRGRAEPAEAPDPAAGEVATAFEESCGRYGARKIEASLARMGIVLSRRRIGRIMKDKGLISAYANAKFKPSRPSADEADVPNIVNRKFDGRVPRTHVVSDLTYVRVGARWCYVCLLIDLYNREIVGHAAGERKDAGLVRFAFATLSFPLDGIEVFHADRGSEFDNAAIDELLDVFEIKRSLSAKGCPYDNSVDESTNKITQGRVRLQGAVLDAARAPGEAERLRQLVQHLQAPLDARLHEPGRVQIGGADSLRKVSKKVLPIQFLASSGAAQLRAGATSSDTRWTSERGTSAPGCTEGRTSRRSNRSTGTTSRRSRSRTATAWTTSRACRSSMRPRTSCSTGRPGAARRTWPSRSTARA